MLKKTLALLPIAAVAGCVLALPPEGTDKADLLAFDDAVASIGCNLVTEADYLPVELQTGLSRDEVRLIAQYKVKAGDAVPLDGGGLRLVTGRCAPVAPAPEPALAPVAAG
ncbi:hypothetical protein KO516_11910 [Citreicella sp. C3M06]|uniref:hypothetical protein n=1 Tax=Citreicella sp. C3M06 TaxID=2841564 RepID=UPI001C0932DB|nr:hypothetical protein [Citreicella sp. C3M06]MBU2961510.1 hypothetical protein [Citreicella sp. C3M06]